MDKKKIIVIGLLIIYIYAFIITLLLSILYFKYVIRLPYTFAQYYIIVFFGSIFISMILLWFPIVHFKGLRKAKLICIPFLLITLLGFISGFITTYFVSLIAAFILGIGSSGSLFIINFVLVKNNEGSEIKIRNSAIALIFSLLITAICYGILLMVPDGTISALEQIIYPGIEPFSVLTPLQVLTLIIFMSIFPAIALLIMILVVWMEKS